MTIKSLPGIRHRDKFSSRTTGAMKARWKNPGVVINNQPLTGISRRYQQNQRNLHRQQTMLNHPPTASHPKPPHRPQPDAVQYRMIPESLVCPAIPKMQLVFPTNGYLEPFPTIQNMEHIARRIRDTTFGQICAVPGANVSTATEPPREALVYDQ
jgi:hypothetical protein